MKLFAGRPRDLKDVATLRLTSTELEFLRRELPRLTRSDQGAHCVSPDVGVCMRVLVLGGTGSMGGPIVRELIRRGHEVIA